MKKNTDKDHGLGPSPATSSAFLGLSVLPCKMEVIIVLNHQNYDSLNEMHVMYSFTQSLTLCKFC